MKIAIVVFSFVVASTSCNTITEKSSEKNQGKVDTVSPKPASPSGNFSQAETVASGLFHFRNEELKNEFIQHTLFGLTDTITADFNGDSILDQAVFIATEIKKGVLITDGQSGMKIKIGLGKSFGIIGDDFSWADFWGTTTDTETYETVFKNDEVAGGKKLKLKHTSIFLRKDEEGGGLITYRNNNYSWVHQAD